MTYRVTVLPENKHLTAENGENLLALLRFAGLLPEAPCGGKGSCGKCTKAYRETEKRHLRQFHRLAEAVKAQHPKALCLGSGGCRVCENCAYPEPCRFPEKACSSMEAYGLFVTDVCRDNGLAYHHGEKTVTYMACVLF